MNNVDLSKRSGRSGLLEGFIIASFCLGLAPRVWGQGQIDFDNNVSDIPPWNVDAPVFDVDCQTRLAGTAYLAQLYVGREPDSLSPVGIAVDFFKGQAGYVRDQPHITIPGAPSGTQVFAQVRAWEAAAGTSYEAAVAARGKHGMSNVIRVTVFAPPNTPGLLYGLQSFCLVPEPSPQTLLLLGGLGLWLVCRRSRGDRLGAAPRSDRSELR